MISLSGIILITRIITIEYPTLTKFFPIPIVSSQHSTGIISTTHYYTWMDSIQISYTSQISFTTISSSISPIRKISSFRNIVYSMHFSSCQTIEHCQIFWARKNPSIFRAIVYLRITYNLTHSIYCTISSFYHYFRASVSIKIKHHKLCIMCTCTYILTHVDTPQSLTIQLITIKNHFSSISVMSVIMRIGRIPF